ncbi:CdaR family transcriptional regulator [Bacillus massiliigorillae]|uniref:CdaR family transcriptional regulator n=1 Tax=Bacillus massiliigorillae TaxID=1243664 RepID=UPI0003A6572E|nr:sugar diacid recognition domain-containing protein [Bacillus massiliigorillae]
MLLEKIAQKIAENTSEIIGHPISITDEKGYIIGATDRQRLGTFHQASLNVLKRKQMICYEVEEVKSLDNVLPGSAVPIIFNREYIGVLGIIGDPEEVKKYTQMIKSYVEMMCQEFMKQEIDILETKKTDTFIHHLIHSTDEDDYNRVMRYGQILGYDLNLNRACILLDIDILSLKSSALQDEEVTVQLQTDLMHDVKYYLIDNKQDIVSSLTIEQFILLKTVNSTETSDMFFKKIKHKFHRFNQYIEVKYNAKAAISIGEIKGDIIGIRESYQDALKALTVGKKTSISPRIYQYNDLNITLELLANGLHPYIQKQLMKNMHAFLTHENFETLASTFMTYCKCNMNLSETSRKLFLHRNSLVYRLEKISKLTSLNINNFEHCLLLYFAIKTQGHTA